MFGFASRMTRAVLLYVIALLIAFAFPGVFSRVKTYLVDRPGLSALGGLAIVLGFAPLCVLLAVTVIGIPLIPVAVLLFNSLWLLATLVGAVALMHFVVIPKEEQYLERKFSAEYLDYKAPVRRWL